MEEGRVLRDDEGKMEDVFDRPVRPTLRQRYGESAMTGKDWTVAALCLLSAAVLCLLPEMRINLRVGLVQLAMVGLGLFAMGKRRIQKSALFLLACDLALILLGTMFYESFLFTVNLAAIPMLTGLALLSAAQVNGRDALSFGAVWETVRRSARGVFEYLPLPVLRIFQKRGGKANGLAAALISLAVCVPVLLTVLLLLSSADAVFSDRIDQICAALTLRSVDHLLLRAMGAVLLGLMLFSWCFALGRPGKPMGEAKSIRIPTVFSALLLTMLDAVYALFVYIQFSHLFGGAETAAMTGGYAQYARSGFFQLVAVAAINLGAVILALMSGRSGWVRAMAGLLIAATGVILVSAVWRMRLYIQVYGLSVLRVMTLWGAAAIGALLIVAAIALVKPTFRAYSAGFVCLILLWVGVNGANIDRIVAEYNVSHYQSGELEQIDEDYIRSLAPGAQSALSRLDAAK